jgi:hypothetical protein
MLLQLYNIKFTSKAVEYNRNIIELIVVLIINLLFFLIFTNI